MSYYEKTLLPEKKHRRHRSRRPTEAYSRVESSVIEIRVGNRQTKQYYNSLRVSGPRDAPLFRTMVDNAVRSNPNDPLVISVNGYRPWLEDIFSICIDDHYSQPALTNREVQFSETVQFPQKSDRRTKWVPWTFIVDQMNLPEVFYWTFGMEPPEDLDLEAIDNYRFRIGAWACGRGAYRGDERTAVVMIFTQPTEIAENIITSLLFPHLANDAEFDHPRMDEEGLAWLFLHLYDLLTDWQNIIREVERRLDEAELNSRGRNIPVKLRTRSMHKEVDRIYELNEYLRFHSRSFKKLAKLKTQVPANEQKEPAWDQIDDATDDLEQYGYYLDSLKERFNNLIELEFNIENANQSDNSRFLSILGTLFLPVSFLASIFGISSVTWPVQYYVYAAIPLFFCSLLFTSLLPTVIRRYQRYQYPLQKEHVRLSARDFTLLGDDLPGNADLPGSDGRGGGGGSGGGGGRTGMAPPMRKSVDERRDPRDVEAGVVPGGPTTGTGRRRRRRRPGTLSDVSGYDGSPSERGAGSRSRSRSRAR